MYELSNPTVLWIKAALFVTAGVMGACGILLAMPRARIAVLLVLTVWCFARAYYFAFYVIERYVDDSFRYAGLWSLLRYAFRQRHETAVNDGSAGGR